MGKYGEAAEIAVTLLAEGSAIEPGDAWNRAVARVFPNSRSSREKVCPRNSFLALCELGTVKGVAPGTYTRSIKNKAYVTRALDALRSNPGLSSDEKRLWQIATAGTDIRPNHQTEVLTTLWRRGLIRPGS